MFVRAYETGKLAIHAFNCSINKKKIINILLHTKKTYPIYE